MIYFIDTEFMEDGRLIEPLSVGITSLQGDRYYAEYPHDPKRANLWVADNVLPKLKGGGHVRPVAKIRQELYDFIDVSERKPEFWGYYADYDWVMLCQTFGKMIDLPKGWPMYCRDLKQWADMLGNPTLPTQDVRDEHNSLADADWNREVYLFLRACEINGYTAPKGT